MLDRKMSWRSGEENNVPQGAIPKSSRRGVPQVTFSLGVEELREYLGNNGITRHHCRQRTHQGICTVPAGGGPAGVPLPSSSPVNRVGVMVLKHRLATMPWTAFFPQKVGNPKVTSCLK
jgi:hypothetical protein